MSPRKHLIAAVLLLSCLAGAARAEPRGQPRDHDGLVRPGAAGVIGRSRDHDIRRWQGERRHHGRHDGHAGARWVVAAPRYIYPAPVVTYAHAYRPAVVVVAAAPVFAPAPPPVQNPPYWYYCPNPPGYYPYVGHCGVDWLPVPATAPPR